VTYLLVRSSCQQPTILEVGSSHSQFSLHISATVTAEHPVMVGLTLLALIVISGFGDPYSAMS
jgi:hypothetical protein